MKFKELYESIMLKESPIRNGWYFENDFDIPDVNHELTKDIMSNSTKIDIFNNGQIYSLYEKSQSNNYKQLFLIDERYPEISGYVIYTKRNDNGIEMGGLWQNKKNISLMFNFYIKYLLIKYKYIMCDSIHSTQGERFWYKLIEYGLKNSDKYYVYIYNNLTNERYHIKDIKQIKNEYLPQNHHIRFVIENKE